ncbi:TlpA family protein disulfide reductase [Salinimicrobium xinjiangense]|uniref:TlpA family protein disulfide reductase n=1 Tax=Salinimicrobium xinjiangense TaxID=438596 RepID=UPI0004093A60|nr:TlpA disulfide reductase family protein [Salinimicrobium xinjiangense]
MNKWWSLIFCFVIQYGFSQAEMPQFVLKDLEGKQVDLQKISEEKTVILSLWATWCVPCINELEAITLHYEDWQNEFDLQLYAISIDDPRTVNRVRPMVRGKGWKYKVLLDTNNDLRRALGAATVPLTLVVRNNKILYKHSGYSPGSEDILYEKLLEFSR